MKKKKAFTLAEVLIALVVIGIIAAIVIGPLTNNTKHHEFRSALKKSISIASQALTLNYALEGIGARGYDSSVDVVQNLFKKRMNVIGKNVAFTDQELCPSEENNDNVFMSADGMLYCVTNWKATQDSETTQCNQADTIACAEDTTLPNLYIDVNGNRKPNKFSTDIYRPGDIYKAHIYNKKVVPFGLETIFMIFDWENTQTEPEEEEPEEQNCDSRRHCIKLSDYMSVNESFKDPSVCNTSCPYVPKCVGGDSGTLDDLDAFSDSRDFEEWELQMMKIAAIYSLPSGTCF